MIRLHLLGSLALLHEDGSPVRSLLAQPKRFALLSYLAVSPWPVALRRDTLLGVFWPDLDEEHARQALRQALHGLRRSLGPGVIVGEGDELVSVDGERLWCDAAAFAGAVKENREEEALELYRGPFLEGFHLSGVPVFERWVEGECRRFRLAAVEAAWRLVARAADNRSEARRWAERALELAPFDEEGLRRYLGLMAEHGQPAAAVRAYEAYAERLAAELELGPSPETVELVERIRAGELAAGRSVSLWSASAQPTLDTSAATASPNEYSETPRRESGPPERMAPAAVAPSPTMTPSHRLRRLALLAAPALVVLAGALLLLRTGAEPSAPAGYTTYPLTALAVLPFQDLSADPAHTYFAAGLHDELLTQLSKVAALSLRGRSSVLGYAGTRKSVRQIAAELEVGALMEGSVQVVGDRLRVNVQLIDAASDEHLWAESYDRRLEDAFAIQSDIAQRVVAAVGAALGAAEWLALAEAPTVDAEAYLLYLQGREYHRRPGYLRQNLESAQQLYERALALDPEFALAYAELSEVHGLMYWFRYDAGTLRLTQQREAAEAALRLAPDLPQPHRAMGLVHYWGRRDYQAALEEFTIALQGLPNDAWLVAVTGYVHRRLGNWDQVITAFEKATQLDPRDATLFLDLGGHTLKLVRRYAEAVRAYERAMGLAPDLHEASVRRAWTSVRWQGRLDSLRAALRLIPPDADLGLLGTTTTQRVQLLHWEREADSLLAAIATAREDAFDRHLAFLPASLYAGWAYQLAGDSAAARAAFDSAAAVLDSVAKHLPDDWRVRAARGLALAGLARREEALREARWLAQSVAYREDAFFGPVLAEERARILAQAGDPEAALDEIERLLAGPSFVSVHTLRLDPLWDPIREQPRFRALAARHGTDASP